MYSSIIIVCCRRSVNDSFLDILDNAAQNIFYRVVFHINMLASGTYILQVLFINKTSQMEMGLTGNPHITNIHSHQSSHQFTPITPIQDIVHDTLCLSHSWNCDVLLKSYFVTFFYKSYIFTYLRTYNYAYTLHCACQYIIHKHIYS